MTSLRRFRAAATTSPPTEGPPWSCGLTLVLWFAFTALALAIYWEALRGPFISDDVLYIVTNPWTASFSLESLLGILNPMGEARFQVANYAPLHLIVTALERRVFWDDSLGYHVVNVLIHSLNAALLVSLFVASGIDAKAALLGGLLFLVHPANVEAVAWISQLKTNGSLALSLGALLTLRRHPGWATLLFGAGLLTKASASFALPMAAAMVWIRSATGSETRSAWAWLFAWTLLLIAYTIPQFTAIQPRGSVVVPAYEDTLVHLRTIASIGTHYLVMAATSLGLAHAPEHPPVTWALDPWWLAGIPLFAWFVWRIVVTLRKRSEESSYWIGAAAAFVPVSQVIPFSHPIGDRYLYFILPGLIGGTLFVLGDFAQASRGGGGSCGAGPRTWRRMANFALIALIIYAGALAVRRARLWTDETLLALDSARHFPSGRSALYLRARAAAQAGDAATSVALLRRAAALGRDQLPPVLFDPVLQPIQGDPLFRELVHDLAGRYIELVASREEPTPAELSAVSRAHFERGEYDEAERALEQAYARGGLLREQLAAELDALRRLRAQLEGPGAGSRLDGRSDGS